MLHEIFFILFVINANNLIFNFVKIKTINVRYFLINYKFSTNVLYAKKKFICLNNFLIVTT